MELGVSRVRNYNGGAWLDRNSVDSMGSRYKTVNTVLHDWICAKMTADDGVFGDLRISAEIGDSESSHMDRKVKEALGEAKVKLERFVEETSYAGSKFVIGRKGPCHVL